VDNCEQSIRDKKCGAIGNILENTLGLVRTCWEPDFKRFTLVFGYKSGISKDEISKTRLENKPPKMKKLKPCSHYNRLYHQIKPIQKINVLQYISNN
jgi:hypothetical protein